MAWHLSGFSEVDYERLREVVDRLPPGPFTADEFLAHATGLNAIRNSSDAQSIIVTAFRETCGLLDAVFIARDNEGVVER